MQEIMKRKFIYHLRVFEIVLFIRNENNIGIICIACGNWWIQFFFFLLMKQQENNRNRRQFEEQFRCLYYTQSYQNCFEQQQKKCLVVEHNPMGTEHNLNIHIQMFFVCAVVFIFRKIANRLVFTCHSISRLGFTPSLRIFICFLFY